MTLGIKLVDSDASTAATSYKKVVNAVYMIISHIALTPESRHHVKVGWLVAGWWLIGGWLSVSRDPGSTNLRTDLRAYKQVHSISLPEHVEELNITQLAKHLNIYLDFRIRN